MPKGSRWLNWEPENTSTPILTGAKTDRTGEAGLGDEVLAVLAPVTLPLCAFSANAKGEQPAIASKSPTALVPWPELPPHLCNHTPFAEEFGLWALARCCFRDGSWGGLAGLHSSFADWCAKRAFPGGGPHQPTFTALLEDEGFTLTERGMIYGMLLREHWEAAQPPPKPPEQLPMFGAGGRL